MANEIMTVQDISNMSVAFAKSGFFGYKNPAEAFSLMCIAQANGLHPAKAAERYHIIQGRPSMKAEAMLSSFQEAGGSVKWIKRTETECKLWLSHPQGGELEVSWTIERAKKAGLTGKSTWSQYPTQMLSARCVSEGVRALFPACLCGMYTPEEVSDFGPSNVPTFSEQTEKPEQAEAEVIEDAPQQQQASAPQPQAPAQPKKKELDEETKQFMDGMKGLWTQAPKIYQSTMDEFGFKSANKVPPERRGEVFNTIVANITKAQQHQSAPTAMEQNNLFNGEENNG